MHTRAKTDAVERRDRGPAGGPTPERARGHDPIPRDLRVHLPEPLAGDRLRLGIDGSWEWRGYRLEPTDNALADRGLDPTDARH